MKIGVIQASTRAKLNDLLYETTKKAAKALYRWIWYWLSPKDAERKRAETQSLQQLAHLTKRPFLEIVEESDQDLLKKVLQRNIFWQYLLENATNQPLLQKLKAISNWIFMQDLIN